MKHEKQKRYRSKMCSLGRCPKCGEPSFPFYYCWKHRLKNNLMHGMRASIKHGLCYRDPDGKGYALTDKGRQENISKGYRIKNLDRRKLPRVNGRPMDGKFYEVEILAFIKSKNRFVHESEIEQHFIKLKTDKFK